MTDVIAAGGGRVLALPGRSAAELVSGAEGGYDVTVRRVTIPPGDGSRPARGPHRHDGCPEVILIVSGAGEFTTPSRTWPVRPGDVIVVSPGEPHQTRNPGPGDLVSLCFFPVPDLAAVTSEADARAGNAMTADVLCLRPEADFHEVGVQPPGDLRIRFAAGPDEIPGADLATARAVVLASVGPALDRAWADRAARLELVQFTGAGVDRAAAAFTGRPGVVVANVPAANAREVAEYVLLATGSLLRGLPLADREIRAGRYREVRGRLTPAAVRSLHSASVGVVGLGQIGLSVARLFQAAGAQVGYSDPAPRDPAAATALGLGRHDLGALLAGSDVVTLHVPLVAATRGLIGQAELHQMRPGAILVNASRGGVVDEAALAAALEDGHLGGAVVDVYAQEPPPAQSPLLTLSAAAADRVLYTPHIAGVAYEAARRLYTEAWANVQRVLVGGLPPANQIGPA